MAPENSDIIALTAQADIHRLFEKVIRPALEEFTPSSDVSGEASDMGEFLDGARINTHNALCHELRRTFALVLAALFERQLRLWVSVKIPERRPTVENASWKGLFELVGQVESSIAAHPVIGDLGTVHLVANAVRHGNGNSARNLLQQMPQLWDQTQTNPDMTRDIVGNMRVDDADLHNFAIAILRFWHLAGASSIPDETA